MNGLQHAKAFVIQFRSDAGTGAGKLAGRVEHVASGRTANFQSLNDLPGILRRMLHDAVLAEQEGGLS